MKILIQKGTIIDGTGKAPFIGDIALENDQIVDIQSHIDPTGYQIFSAEGFIVSPGFIDTHTHSDRTIFEAPYAQSHIFQGVTTVFPCQCGIGPFPITEEHKAELKSYLDTFLGSLPDDSLPWTDFEEFASYLEKLPLGVNIAPLAAHGALRISVIGPEDRPATQQELNEMTSILETSLHQGAWGLTLGLVYPPGSFATKEELISLGKILARYDAPLSTHVRNENAHLLKSIDEMIQVGRESRSPILISHLKAIGAPNWGSAVIGLEKIIQARQSGLKIWADQYPYEATSTALSVLAPAWSHDGGIPALINRLKDPNLTEQLLEAIKLEMNIRGGADKVKIAVIKNPANQRWIGQSISEIATELKLSPEETVRHLLIEEGGKVNAIYFSLSDLDLEKIITSSIVAVGSDGYALDIEKHSNQNVHPRAYGPFPRVLGHYVREKKLLSLEAAIWKMTGLAAEIYGLPDRGILKSGYKADIVIFDAQTIEDKATFINPHQYPVGVEAVFVNGVLTTHHGKLTGQHSGKVLKKTYSKREG